MLQWFYETRKELIFMLNKPLSKESVGKIALAVTSASTIILSGLFYNEHVKVLESNVQLGKAQERISQEISNYNKLEIDYSSVKDDNVMLSNNLMKSESQLDRYKEDNKTLKKELSDSEKSVKSLREELSKKNRVEATKTKVKSNSVASTKSTKSTKSVSKSSGYKGWKKMSVEATGYSLISDELGSDGTPSTATGTYPTAGRTIAVDPNVIPYGTEVYIPAMGGTYIAEDTGGMIKNRKIDIYMSHGDIARKWGRQQIDIYVNM